MATTMTESARALPVTQTCEVLVAGGGVAGIAAALAAARTGADTLLIEKQCVLGGLATAGLVTIYLPLCDGRGHQISYGIAEELFRLSIAHGWQDRYPAAWLEGGTVEERAKKRFEVQFNPVYFALEAERLLLEAGVRILYDTRLCGVETDGQRAGAAIVENEDGRGAIRFGAAVEATGTARLLRMAGEETQIHGTGNSVAGWYYDCAAGKLQLHMLGLSDAAEGSEHEGVVPGTGERFAGDNGEDVNAFLLRSHAATLSAALQRAARVGGEPTSMTGMPQFRMIRRLCGTETMTEAADGCAMENSVGMVSDWRKRGPKFEVPYGALYGTHENIFAAGRCVSADDGMWDVMRSIPCCAVTGEAAGIAAACTPKAGRTPVGQVQGRLRAAGQKLYLSELEI